MGRQARVVIAEVARHVTQRSNGRQSLLATDSERRVYLDLLRQAVHLHALSVIGYGLMSNHVHRVLIPHRSESLALALRALRRSTYAGRPLGPVEFIASLEQLTLRRLSAQKGGRPRKTPADGISKASPRAR
jgi:putative transposase